LKATGDAGTRNWFVREYKSMDVNPLLLTAKEYLQKVKTVQHADGSKQTFYFLGSRNSVSY